MPRNSEQLRPCSRVGRANIGLIRGLRLRSPPASASRRSRTSKLQPLAPPRPSSAAAAAWASASSLVRRRLGFERHVARPPERHQHPIELLLAGLDAAGVHQPLADQPADQVDLGRGVEHVGQQPPGQRAAAVQLARRGRAELVELGLVPILLVRPARGHLLLQRLLRLQQARVFRVLGDLVVLLVPAGDLHVVLVGQHEDVALPCRTAAGRRGRKSDAPCWGRAASSCPAGLS